MKKALVFLALSIGVALPALAESPKVKSGMLVDEHGKTLYTFDKDVTPGKSMCVDGCAAKWPVAQADEYDKPSGEWTIIKRDDGKHQWAYKGHPLYSWVMDKNPGDAQGEGVGGVWHVAKP